MTDLNNSPTADNHLQVCPWWLCFTFDNIFRRWVQKPEPIVNPYIRPGATVLDVGPGMGYFTIPMARLVGDSGKVIAVDLQEKMLNSLYQRAQKAGVGKRILLHQNTPDKIGINEPVDFCLAFWMVHEVADQSRFLSEIYSQMKHDGRFLLVEPRFHVSGIRFTKTVIAGEKSGFVMIDQPRIFLSYTALFRK
jgi:ubiquinone/menaquinone biosynthesis C-methylase UbiE